MKLTKVDGLIGFIQPNKFLSADYGINTLNFIVSNSKINLIKNVSLDKTFEDASVYPYIFIFKKKTFKSNIEIKNISIFDVCEKNNLIGFETELKSIDIINKIKNLSKKLSDYSIAIKRGVPNNKLNFSSNGKYNAVSSTDLSMPYSLNHISQNMDYIDTNYEDTKNSEFSQPIILLPRTILNIRAILSTNGTHILDRIYYILLNIKMNINIKTILLLLNSKITTFYYDYFYGSTKIGGGYIDLKGTQISNFPIFEKINNEDVFIEKADRMLELTKNLHNAKQNFIYELKLEKIPKKLRNFEELEFDEFAKEYKKAKKLKFTDKLEERNFKNEWKALFENDSKIALDLKLQIITIDKEIDKMVYELYGLNDDEIKIVEKQ
ncbi:MAG: hypothetical protein JJV94_05010 [Sulfurospirillum sp.]|nr:hypothetical protein [Sulfurospirillum sp.]